MLPELETIIIDKRSDLYMYGALMLLIAILWLVFNFLNFNSIYDSLSTKQLRLLIEASAEIVVIIVLTFVLTHQIRELRKTSCLEELERDIYMNGLSEEDIRERLETGYFGSDLKTWILRQRERFSDQVEAFLKTFTDFETRLSSLTQDELLVKRDIFQAERIHLGNVIKQIYDENASKLKALTKKVISNEEINERDIYLKIYLDRAAELKKHYLNIQQKLSI